MRPIAPLAAAFASVFALAGAASAQSVAGVPSADVVSGERLLDYRAGYALADDGRSSRFGQRIHYQHSLSDDWRVRLLLQQGEDENGVIRTQFISLQTQHQLIDRKRSGGLASAVRLDGFIPADGRPWRARLVFLNSLDFDNGVQLRGDFFLARDFGDERAEGIDVETRAEVSFPLTARTRVGAQLYDRFGATANFGGFDEQRHQAGVFARSKITKTFGVEAGWLIGVSRAAPDADVRMILTYSF